MAIATRARRESGAGVSGTNCFDTKSAAMRARSPLRLHARAMRGSASAAVLALSLTIALSASAAIAQELPSGGSVTSGSATIVRSGSNLVVNQTSQNAILSWQSFSVGGNASAHFANGTGATLNRVTGNLPSSIDGSLTATGSLYLINPAGVAVGTGGMVRTGGSFVASTHDATDADFLDGGALTLKGDSKAAVVNRGFVASLSGDVVLTARRVENAGTVEAPEGSVGLLGGYEVELRDTSLADGKFAVKVGGADTEVVNTGTVRAAEIEMRANGGSVQALAGNTKAIVKATGVKKAGGRIFLTAGSGGTVRATQKMVARRAVQPAQRQEVASLPDNGPLPTARPDFAGGEVHIAGGAVSLGGTIDAAGSGADGGTILAVADGRLAMDGGALLDASGSSGGFIETSGAALGIGSGVTVVARGDAGPAGAWLIDPTNLTVDAAAAPPARASRLPETATSR
jgi:filamentous hemagglutinin family protein